jgi:hypothetical protein
MMTEFKTIIITDYPGDMLDTQEYYRLRSSVPPGCVCPFCRQIKTAIPHLILAMRNHGDLTSEPNTSSSSSSYKYRCAPYLLIQHPLFITAGKKLEKLKK